MLLSCMLNGHNAPQVIHLPSLDAFCGQRTKNATSLRYSHHRQPVAAAQPQRVLARDMAISSTADSDSMMSMSETSEDEQPSSSQGYSSSDGEHNNQQQQQSPPPKQPFTKKYKKSYGNKPYQTTRRKGDGRPALDPELKFFRMSAEDERMAHVDGHFRQRLTLEGYLDEDGNPTPAGLAMEGDIDACVMHMNINKMLSMNRRYKTVLAVVRDVGHVMGPVNVATAMHRLGKLVRRARMMKKFEFLPQVQADPNYKRLIARLKEVLPESSPRAICNFMWGLAALGDTQTCSQIIDELLDHVMKFDLNQVKTQELSNLVWALARLDCYRPAAMDKILESAASRIDDCIPQALSNMTWACATLRHRHPAFLDAVARSAVPRLRNFDSQTLANTLWAYSVLNSYPASLFQAAADEITTRLLKLEEKRQKQGEEPMPSQPPFSETDAAFQGQEISNILIAFARGQIIHRGMLQAMENELCAPSWIQRDNEMVYVPRLQAFTSQALANSLWAFASMRWYPARLLPAITEAIGRVVPLMTEQELANSAWAYARFAYHPGRVISSYLQVIEARTEHFDCQSCTNMLWALAVLKATHSTAFIKMLRRFLDLERGGDIIGEMQYNQILQAVLLAQFEARGGRVAWRPEVDLPEDVVDKALSAWASQQAETQLSGFHLDVSQALKRLGIAHRIEYLVARDLLSIDIAVIKDGRRIAIEVDGPFHFPINARTPLGHTMIRRRLLRAAGWTVVSIPWYEWFAMDSWTARNAFLVAMLEKADVTFAEQLKPANMLSTDFEPGPGADTSTAASPTGTAFDEGGEDGPTLSDLEEEVFDTADKEDLREVLTRSNIQLTSGAIRRLISMGMSRELKQLAELQGYASGKVVGSEEKLSREQQRMLQNYNNTSNSGAGEQQSGSQSDAADGPTTGSSGRTGDHEIRQSTSSRSVVPNDGMPMGSNPEGNNAQLLPKPKLQYYDRPNRATTRFLPQFADGKRRPHRTGDVAWGIPPSELVDPSKINNSPINDSDSPPLTGPANRRSSSGGGGGSSGSGGSGKPLLSSLGNTSRSSSSYNNSSNAKNGSGSNNNNNWAVKKPNGRILTAREQSKLTADAADVLNRALHGRSLSWGDNRKHSNFGSSIDDDDEEMEMEDEEEEAVVEEKTSPEE